MGIAYFLRFCVKKRSKHVGFHTCNIAVAAAKSFFDQHLDAKVFHVKQSLNHNLGLSSSAIDFHFLLFSAFWDASRLGVALA
jgi:hypothetical protein